MNPALYRILETHYRRRRTGLLILAGICFVILFVSLGWGISDLVDRPPARRCPPRSRFYASCSDAYYRAVLSRSAVLTGIPAVILLITGFALWPLREIDQAPLVRIFTSQRDEVAWIYPKRTSVRRYGVEVRQIHAVVVGLLSRKRIELNMPTEGEVQEAVRLMAAEAPRAARGYESDRQAQFLRDPSSLLSTAAAPPRVAGAPAAPASPVRMVVAPECPFARIDTGIRYLGLALEPAPGAPMAGPGEPTSAVWAGRGARVVYTLDPRLWLRVLDLSGVEPERLRHELATVVGVPALGPQQVLGMLVAPDPRYALLGVLAAEALGAGEERRTYQGAVAGLQGHPDPAVAEAAQRVSRGWA